MRTSRLLEKTTSIELISLLILLTKRHPISSLIQHGGTEDGEAKAKAVTQKKLDLTVVEIERERKDFTDLAVDGGGRWSKILVKENTAKKP